MNEKEERAAFEEWARHYSSIPITHIDAWVAGRNPLHAEIERIRRVIVDKFHKYETDMEGADEPEFGQAEWAAGAMRQLFIDLYGIDQLVNGMPSEQKQ